MGGAADPEPWSMEVPDCTGAEMGRVPRRIEVEGWSGVLDYITVKP